MMGQPLAYLITLLIGERRRLLIVKHTIEQAVGYFEPLSRREVLQLRQQSCLVLDAKILVDSRFSKEAGVQLDVLSALGEALTYEAEGVMTPPASNTSPRALGNNPDDARAMTKQGLEEMEREG